MFHIPDIAGLDDRLDKLDLDMAQMVGLLTMHPLWENVEFSTAGVLAATECLCHPVINDLEGLK